MKIMVDMSSAQPQNGMKINGGGEYSYTIFSRLVEVSNVELIVLLNATWGENTAVLNLCEKKNLEIKYFSNSNEINSIISSSSIDKFFIPVCYSKYHDLVVDNKIQLITVIHDLCELYYKRLPVKYGKYNDGWIIDLLLRVKDRITCNSYERSVIEKHNRLINISKNQLIVTVSHYTKSAMIKYLNVGDSNRIHVMYTPDKTRKNTGNGIIVKLDARLEHKRFFLMCAGNRWAKNTAIVMFVLDSLFSDRKYDELLSSFKVVLLGVDKKVEKYYKHRIKNINRFIFKGYVDDAEMDFLYSEAYMFCFPSMLEGFGMPPIEALQHGTITACSTAMSIPEVCESSVIYFDPVDEESIKLAILRGFDTKYIDKISAHWDYNLEHLALRRENDLSELVHLLTN